MCTLAWCLLHVCGACDADACTCTRACALDDTDQLILIMDTLVECGGIFHTDNRVACVFASKLNTWIQEGFKELGDGERGMCKQDGACLSFLAKQHKE